MPPPLNFSTHRIILDDTLFKRSAELQQYEDTDTFVFDFPDSSDYTIGIIVDPCKVSGKAALCTGYIVVYATSSNLWICAYAHAAMSP